MSTDQRKVLIFGLSVMLLMILVPPWTSEEQHRRAFPARTIRDLETHTVYVHTYAPAWEQPQPERTFNVRVVSQGAFTINYPRLAFQLAAAALFTLILVLLIGHDTPRPDRPTNTSRNDDSKTPEST